MKSEKIKKLYKDRHKIVEGISNLVFLKKEVNRIAAQRDSICQSNVCGQYDKDGSSEKAFIKGSAACAICGCNIRLLTHSLHSECSLHEIGQEPLWKMVLTEDEEDSLNI